MHASFFLSFYFWYIVKLACNILWRCTVMLVYYRKGVLSYCPALREILLSNLMSFFNKIPVGICPFSPTSVSEIGRWRWARWAGAQSAFQFIPNWGRGRGSAQVVSYSNLGTLMSSWSSLCILYNVYCRTGTCLSFLHARAYKDILYRCVLLTLWQQIGGRNAYRCDGQGSTILSYPPPPPSSV